MTSFLVGFDRLSFQKVGLSVKNFKNHSPRACLLHAPLDLRNTHRLSIFCSVVWEARSVQTASLCHRRCEMWSLNMHWFCVHYSVACGWPYKMREKPSQILTQPCYQITFPNKCMKNTYNIKVSVKSKPVIRKGITGALNWSKCWHLKEKKHNHLMLPWVCMKMNIRSLSILISISLSEWIKRSTNPLMKNLTHTVKDK